MWDKWDSWDNIEIRRLNEKRTHWEKNEIKLKIIAVISIVSSVGT